MSPKRPKPPADRPRAYSSVARLHCAAGALRWRQMPGLASTAADSTGAVPGLPGKPPQQDLGHDIPLPAPPCLNARRTGAHVADRRDCHRSSTKRPACQGQNNPSGRCIPMAADVVEWPLALAFPTLGSAPVDAGADPGRSRRPWACSREDAAHRTARQAAPGKHRRASAAPLARDSQASSLSEVRAILIWGRHHQSTPAGGIP